MYIFFDMDFNIFVENDDWINVGMLYWFWVGGGGRFINYLKNIE